MPLCAQLLGIVQKEVDKIKKDIADGNPLDYTLFVSDEIPQQLLVEVPLETKEISQEHPEQSVEETNANHETAIEKKLQNVAGEQIVEPGSSDPIISTVNAEPKIDVLEKEEKPFYEHKESDIIVLDSKMGNNDDIGSSLKDSCDKMTTNNSSVTKDNDSSDVSKAIDGIPKR
ncbi:unnamed protein product [[Candida] boidinii]|nr:unnamed protein product [[Candida] boidinii]